MMFMAYFITFSLFAGCIGFAIHGMNLCKASDKAYFDNGGGK